MGIEFIEWTWNYLTFDFQWQHWPRALNLRIGSVLYLVKVNISVKLEDNQFIQEVKNCKESYGIKAPPSITRLNFCAYQYKISWFFFENFNFTFIAI
jgi:hypothetical protein